MTTAPTPRYFLTVPTGFEFVARQELAEKLTHHACETQRGKVIVQTDAPIDTLMHLRSCFHVYGDVTVRDDLPMDDAALGWLEALPAQFDWAPAITQWARRFGRADQPQSFRISAQRSGDHTYTSMQAAAALGSGVQARFGWPVNLNEPDIDIYAHLQGHELLLGVSLTPKSLHFADGLERGRTGLKQPIAYGLARLAELQPHETTLDPMGGVGTLPIEASALQPGAWHLAGDRDRGELARAMRNRARSDASFALLQWDARDLPISSAAMDVILCDLPFGVRVGSHRRNVHLYPPVFAEMARVLKPGGRAILLSLERRLVERRVQKDRRWTVAQRFSIHYGGLDPTVFVLRRGA